MIQYFVWEWQKFPLSNFILRGMQNGVFNGVDKVMADMEGMKIKDIRREWAEDETRYIYKETTNPEDIEKIKYKLENIGVAKINELIQKVKGGKFRLLPKKMRDKLGVIKYSEGKSPLEKTQDTLMFFGIYWGYRIIDEKEFLELQAKDTKNI
jgi:hypothetical protein